MGVGRTEMEPSVMKRLAFAAILLLLSCDYSLIGPASAEYAEVCTFEIGPNENTEIPKSAVEQCASFQILYKPPDNCIVVGS